MKAQKSFKQFISMICVSFFLVTTAWGHGAWIEKRQGEIVVVYAHGAQEDEYKPEKVALLKAYDAKGKKLKVNAKKAVGGYVPLDIGKKTTVVELKFDNGYWSVDTDGKWHNLPKNEVENAKRGGQYVKYNLTILDHFVKLPALNMPLVIIPQSDPLKLVSGEELRIRVMYKGQPYADAKIIGDYVNQCQRISAVTNEGGYATLTVRNQGLNVISVAKDEKLKNNPYADKRGLFGTLSFTLKSGD